MSPEERPDGFWRIILAVLLALLLREVFAMAHGARTWSNVGADEVVHGLADMGELAARMWSPDTFNREGNVIFMESFESGLQPWNPAAAGTGGEIRISNILYRSSGYSCRMQDGSEYANGAQINRAFPVPSLGRYSFEFSAHMDDNLQYLIATLAYRDGTTEHQFQVTYSPLEDELLQTIPGGSSVAFATDVDLHHGSGLFHTFKLVADFSDDEWVRVILNETEYTPTDYGPYTFGETLSPHVNVTLTTYGEDGENSVTYIDDILVKQNEPP